MIRFGRFFPKFTGRGPGQDSAVAHACVRTPRSTAAERAAAETPRPIRGVRCTRPSGPRSRPAPGFRYEYSSMAILLTAEVARRISGADPRTETTYIVRTTLPCRAGHQHPRSLSTYVVAGISFIMPPSGSCRRRSQVDTSFGESTRFLRGQNGIIRGPPARPPARRRAEDSPPTVCPTL